MGAGERSLVVHCTGPDVVTQALDPDTAPVRIHFARLDEQRGAIDELAALLDPVERERAARFRFDVDRERFIIAHGTLRRLLGTALNMDPRAVRMMRGPFGKPYLAASDLHFNLSDTKDALVIALSLQGPLGVDIETMTRTVDHEAVGLHYFGSEEVSDIGQSEEPKRRFLELWTRKEAVLKACGVGIMEDLRVLRVHEAENRSTIRHEAFIQHAAPEYHVRTWLLGSDHIISLAMDSPSAPPAWILPDAWSDHSSPQNRGWKLSR